MSVVVLCLSACHSEAFPTAELLAKSLEQRWYRLAIDEQHAGKHIGLQVATPDQVLTSGGVTCPPPGIYAVMVQVMPDKTIRWFIDGNDWSGSGANDALTDKVLPVRAIRRAHDDRPLELGQVVIAFGADVASVDVLKPGMYHVSFQITESE